MISNNEHENNPMLVWLKTCTLNFLIFLLYSRSSLGRNRINHHSISILNHLWGEIKLMHITDKQCHDSSTSILNHLWVEIKLMHQKHCHDITIENFA
jgi:hypothetical protein